MTEITKIIGNLIILVISVIQALSLKQYKSAIPTPLRKGTDDHEECDMLSPIRDQCEKKMPLCDGSNG
jgi:hypothetical protein